MDGVIPTSRLPDVLRRIGEMSDAYGLKVANIFHAGDGNLHPLIMFDANDPASFHKAEQFGADILKLCVEVGGCLTGEHGVGVEKRDLMPRAVHADRNWISSAGSSRRSIPAGCSTRTRCSRWSEHSLTIARCQHDRGRDRGGRRAMRRRTREPLLVVRQRHQVRHAAPGAGGALAVDPRHLSGITLYSPKELIISRPCRHAACRDRGDAGRARPAHHRRTTRSFGALRRAANRRPWAAWSPPICPVRGASPGARCATTCWACGRSPAAAR